MTPWGEAHRPAPDPAVEALGAKALALLAEYHQADDADFDAGCWEQRSAALVAAWDDHARGRARRSIAQRMASHAARGAGE